MDVCTNRYGVASLSVGDASGVRVGGGAKYERAKADVGSGMRAAQGRALVCGLGRVYCGLDVERVGASGLFVSSDRRVFKVFGGEGSTGRLDYSNGINEQQMLVRAGGARDAEGWPVSVQLVSAMSRLYGGSMYLILEVEALLPEHGWRGAVGGFVCATCVCGCLTK